MYVCVHVSRHDRQTLGTKWPKFGIWPPRTEFATLWAVGCSKTIVQLGRLLWF